MKKIYSSIVLIGAAMSIWACTNVMEPADDSQKSNAPVIYASHEGQNRSSISVNDNGVGTIYWSPADDISIFYGASTPVRYTSTNLAPETTAAFTTTAIVGSSELASANIWGLYPYNSSAVCDGSSITTTLPATQYAVPGTFDDDLFITVAHSDNTNLHFYNVCGGIKFSLSRDDITTITFAGNNNEDLAGDITVSFVDGLPKVDVASGIKTITLTPKNGGTFAANTYYYIIALPQSLTSGFTMTFETGTEVGTFNYSNSAVTIKRSVFSKKDEIDEYAEFVSKLPGNIIYYTSTDGNVILPSTTAPQLPKFDANIVSNSYNGDYGVITFDHDITEIGGYAFEITNLKSISLPDGVISIGMYSFNNCESLQSINLPNGLMSIGEGAFYACYKLSSIDLPKGLTVLGRNAFYSCLSLQSISLPLGIDSVPFGCFSGCKSLQSVTLHDGIVAIEQAAFWNCVALSSIDIPIGVTTIGRGAFRSCSNLQEIIIPENVEAIGELAFMGCENLHTVYVRALVPPERLNYNPNSWNPSFTPWFEETSSSLQIFVPAGSIDLYKAAPVWSDYADKIHEIQD